MDRREYADRTAAGRTLAGALQSYAGRPGTMVLGLARGGIPLAASLAEHLRLPLGALVVKKLGVPGHEETAFGALATLDGTVVEWLNTPFRERLLREGYSPTGLDAVRTRERAALLDRFARYPAPDLPPAPATLIVADDGLATGATMCAAILAVRACGPAEVVAAAPVGSREACAAVGALADRVVCPRMPPHFFAVGNHYLDFRQTTDAQALALLAR
ncbi:phosphoribosyltransferase [Pseudarthrobacter sp. P1]|uniref:phosphoribosyltransferase n=1 Tax=Pseudarthrobacter sp. P1 TaxID=3418418 RepID=UPI003CF84F68